MAPTRMLLALMAVALLLVTAMQVTASHPPFSMQGRPLRSLDDLDPLWSLRHLHQHQEHDHDELAARAEEDLGLALPVDAFARGAGAGIVLASSKPVLADGDSIVLTVTGVPQQWNCAKDFVSISCGPTAGLHDYIDSVLVTNVSPAGAATQTLQVAMSDLVQLRCAYNFTYFHVGSSKSGRGAPATQALAFVVVKMSDAPVLPKQVHLSFGDGPEQMWASWVSSSNQYTPLVRYGTQPATAKQPYPFLSKGSSTTSAAADFCGPPANQTAQAWFRDPGFMHHVLMTNLLPSDGSSRYYYSVGNDVEGWSAEFSFLSPRAAVPLAEASTAPIRFLALADHGVAFPGGAPQKTAANLFAEATGQGGTADPYDAFVLHPGDIAYGVGVGWRWDAWGTQVEPIASAVPWMTGVGNHEYDHTLNTHAVDPSGVEGPTSFKPSWGDYCSPPFGDSNGECGLAQAKRMKSPSNGNSIFWYSFDYAYMHVVMMSSEHDYQAGSVQRAWLEADLAAVNRRNTVWTVVTFHRQMYTAQLPAGTERVMAQHMQDELGPLFLRSGVNLVLMGHQHSMERTCAVFGTTCVPSGQAPVYMVIGTAGAPLEAGGFDGNISIAHTDQYGYLRVNADLEQMHVQFVLNDGAPEAVFDDITLRPYNGEEAARALGLGVEVTQQQQQQQQQHSKPQESQPHTPSLLPPSSARRSRHSVETIALE